jgi:hypothetical protein
MSGTVPGVSVTMNVIPDTGGDGHFGGEWLELTTVAAVCLIGGENDSLFQRSLAGLIATRGSGMNGTQTDAVGCLFTGSVEDMGFGFARSADDREPEVRECRVQGAVGRAGRVEGGAGVAMAGRGDGGRGSPSRQGRCMG